MPNRTEILHFRATPEEKETIRENAGHAELALSEWMRQRSLDRLVPTQPVVEADLAKLGYVVETIRPSDGETYEQFMERRVGELVGENPSPGDDQAARANAYAEWLKQGGHRV